MLETSRNQKLFWTLTVWIDCSSDLKIFENSMPSASDFKSFSGSGQTILITKYHFQTLLLCTNKIYFPILTEFWRLYACGLKNVLKYLNDEGANEMPDFQPPLIWEEKNSSSPQHSINYFLKNRTTFWF